jgi:hypothetical protein
MSANPFPTPYPVSNNFNRPLPGSMSDLMGGEDYVTGIMPAGNAVFGTIMVNDPTVALGSSIGGMGVDGQGVKYATSQGDVTAGVAGLVVRTGALETRRDTLPPSYGIAVPINLCRRGRPWTASEVAVTKHDPVYVRITANGALNTLGALRNDADGGNAILVPGVKWYDTQPTALANGLGYPARVELALTAQ